MTEKKKIVQTRWKHCDFEWTPENTKRIIEVINAIDKKVNQMYDVALKVRDLFSRKSIPKAIRRDYGIEVTMSYEDVDATPIADETMMAMLYDETDWDAMPAVYFDVDCPQRLRSRSEALYGDLNWNIKLFDRPELANIQIPFYVHMLFNNSYTYTLNDMLHMNPEHFFIHVLVKFWGDNL